MGSGVRSLPGIPMKVFSKPPAPLDDDACVSLRPAFLLSGYPLQRSGMMHESEVRGGFPSSLAVSTSPILSIFLSRSMLAARGAPHSRGAPRARIIGFQQQPLSTTMLISVHAVPRRWSTLRHHEPVTSYALDSDIKCARMVVGHS